MEHRSTDTTLVVVAEVSAGLGILEPKIAILLDAEPVDIQVACVFEALELCSVSNDRDGSSAVLLDDLESVFWPGDSSGAAPEGVRGFGRCRKCIRPAGGG